MILLNTRPSERAHVLSNALQAQGVTVLDLPLLELNALQISEREQGYQHAFIQFAHAYHALVVISPTAAKLGLGSCPQGFRPHCPVIAVGQATANVLNHAGWQVVCPLESSNEAMMQMAALSTLSVGDKVLVWRGRGGRRLLVTHLQHQGVTVDAIAWYQRQRPTELDTLFTNVESELNRLIHSSCISPSVCKATQAPKPTVNKPIVLISSGEAFKNWQEVITKSKSYRLHDFSYLTFGKRLTDTLTNLTLTCQRIDNLDPDNVWQGMQALQKAGDSG